MSGVHGSGPVVFAYDGSDLASQAIEEAGRLLVAGDYQPEHAPPAA